mgnify:CR=1 FL=1
MYPKKIRRETKKLNELSKVMNRDLNVSLGEYSKNGNGTQMLSAATYEGHAMTELQNKQHYIGVDLVTNPFKAFGNGVKTNKQITFERTVTIPATTTENRQLKYFVHNERMLQIKNGLVSITA